jgi:hypothetical protein
MNFLDKQVVDVDEKTKSFTYDVKNQALKQRSFCSSDHRHRPQMDGSRHECRRGIILIPACAGGIEFSLRSVTKNGTPPLPSSQGSCSFSRFNIHRRRDIRHLGCPITA